MLGQKSGQAYLVGGKNFLVLLHLDENNPVGHGLSITGDPWWFPLSYSFFFLSLTY